MAQTMVFLLPYDVDTAWRIISDFATELLHKKQPDDIIEIFNSSINLIAAASPTSVNV